MAFTEGKTKRECSYLRGLVGWKRTKSHGGCVLNERAVQFAPPLSWKIVVFEAGCGKILPSDKCYFSEWNKWISSVTNPLITFLIFRQMAWSTPMLWHIDSNCATALATRRIISFGFFTKSSPKSNKSLTEIAERLRITPHRMNVGRRVFPNIGSEHHVVGRW